ncbi:hypothetical protein BACUNI_01784 [Bacteroides uniformis ATCC 8492]|uniref:Uncharacterized protein n=1 Tax=Bacteroides uniformis (strain ATCC 8492 / DSM 6597 / CCUG 4942 / CIP 103695 / JCM 5828 / KCTC 5204 / NCTC 13054 / VPI 0061) TaxID=411479 RepID=A0ABC9NDW3_BACUC|nr:hypothetical protein BACUNI_03208 [Bacteroides uniformis ATCC 8492]EDO54799.1 hypothetical protein BACUNI_01784 [Bacteroides uniformis ATCC 8492]
MGWIRIESTSRVVIGDIIRHESGQTSVYGNSLQDNF